MNMHNKFLGALLAVAIAMPAAAQSPAERTTSLIQSINNPAVAFSTKVEKKNKKAGSFLTQWYADTDAEFSTKDIDLTFSVAGDNDVLDANTKPTLVVTVKNRTNKILYIDLANTFIVCGDDSQPFYVPSETQIVDGVTKSTSGTRTPAPGTRNTPSRTTSKTKTTDKTHIETTTIIAQRVVSIPPRSSKKLEQQRIFTPSPEIEAMGRKGDKYVGDDVIRLQMQQGSSLQWTADNSPVRFGAFVTYAFSEDLASTGDTAGGTFYLRKAWGLGLPFLSFTDYDEWLRKNFTGYDTPGIILFPLTNSGCSNLSTFGGQER